MCTGNALLWPANVYKEKKGRFFRETLKSNQTLGCWGTLWTHVAQFELSMAKRNLVAYEVLRIRGKGFSVDKQPNLSKKIFLIPTEQLKEGEKCRSLSQGIS